MSLLLVCLFAFQDGPKLTDIVQAYDQATLGRAVPIFSTQIKKGHLKVTLDQGSIAPVQLFGQDVGVFFKGTGSFEYVSSDRVEAAVLRNNVDKATGLALESKDDGRHVSGDFRSLFLYGSFEPLPGPSDFGAPDLVSSFEKHRTDFAGDVSSVAAHRFVKQIFDMPASPYSRIELGGGKEDVVHMIDPLESHTEQLYVLRGFMGQVPGHLKNARYGISVSEVPWERNWQDFLNPPFLLTHVDLTLNAPKKGDANLEVVETLLPMDRNQRIFRFNLFSEQSDDSFKTRTTRVKHVRNAAGKELSFHHAKDQLLVDLEEPAVAGQEVKLHFAIEGDFLIRPNNDNFWQLGVAPWFPIPELNGQYMTVHCKVSVEDPFIAFAPGKTLRREKMGDFNYLETQIDKPVQFMVIHAGKYYVEEVTREGLTVRVASYGMKKKRAASQLARLAVSIIDFYEPWLGPFPFPELNVLEINAYGYGQAPPGTMFITKEAFEPLSDAVSSVFSQGANHRYAHEIAHQYWGHVIKMGGYEEQWLTESFAEYSSSLFIKYLKGDDAYRRMVQGWLARTMTAVDAASIPTANRLSGKDSIERFRNRTALVYDKGAYLLYQLHQELGDDDFLTFLRSYQGLFAWKYGTTKDVVSLLNHITKKDYTAFFETNYWGSSLTMTAP